MSKLETRLTRQLAAKGTHDAKGLAHSLLIQRGHIKPDGTLTDAGRARQELGAAGRAKDRATRYNSNHTAEDYAYNKRTNSVKLKK
jgi:hypothetical protein